MRREIMQFRRKIVRITLLTLISTVFGAILGAFLGHVFHRYRADTETNPNSQSEKLKILKFDRTTSAMAHSAQLTLISILVGAILGALFIGLPNRFAINIWSKSNLDLDFRVLTVFLAAVDLWIKYSWAVIVVRWPFSLLHNFTFFFVT